MKKFSILFLFFLLLNFTQVKYANALIQNLIKQGVYTLSDLNYSKDNLYEVKNTSSKECAYIAVFDENNIILQSIRLEPNSASYNLVPLKADYKIVVLGKAEIFIDPKITK